MPPMRTPSRTAKYTSFSRYFAYQRKPRTGGIFSLSLCKAIPGVRHRPPVGFLKDCARQLLDAREEGESNGIRLFDNDVENTTGSDYARAMFGNEEVERNLGHILAFVLDVGKCEKWAISDTLQGGIPLTTLSTLEGAFSYTPNHGPRRDDGTRSLIRRMNSATIIRSIISGINMAERNDGLGIGCLLHSNVDVVSMATRSTRLLKAFLLRLCKMTHAECAVYDAPRCADLRALWESIVLYVDRYFIWSRTGRNAATGITDCMAKNFRALIGTVEEAAAADDAPGVVDYVRLGANLVHSLGILEHMGSTPRLAEWNRQDFESVDFHPLHPCDSALRCVIGNSRSDYIVQRIWDSEMMRGVTTYPPLDTVTSHVAGRRIRWTGGDDIPMGCEGWTKRCLKHTEEEALLHTLFHGPGVSATHASGYEPTASFMLQAVVGPRVKWFPGYPTPTQMQLHRCSLVWPRMAKELNAGGSATLEYVLIAVRSNFSCMFNENERTLAGNLLTPSAAHAGGTLESVVESCVRYMRGPVLRCVKRRDAYDAYTVGWTEASRRFVSGVSIESVVGIVRCMYDASHAIDAVISKRRKEYFRGLLATGRENVLRHYLFRRCALASLPETNPLHAHFTHEETAQFRPGAFGNVECCEIVQCCGAELFPELARWRREYGRETFLDTLIGWLAHARVVDPAAAECVPEPMVPSLPFLDRIGITLVLHTALMASVQSGLQDADSPTAHALASAGIDRETYEWDSAFVRRMCLRGGVEDTRYRELEEIARAVCGAEGSAAVNAVVNAARGRVARVARAAVLGCDLDTDLAGDPICALLLQELRPLRKWFEREMSAYGVLYVHFFPPRAA
jgi:hypothetical protein